MPSALVENFIGSAYTPRSTSIDDEALINLYPESTRQPGAVKSRALIGTPGLGAGGTFATVSCRGMFAQLSATLAVYGNTLYFNTVAVATVVNDGNPVSFASNGDTGNQIAVCSGGSLYICNATTGVTTAAIALPFTTATFVGFLDGYFLLHEQFSATIWFSHLYNGLVWDALDFFTRSHTADNIVSFVVVDSRIWTFGSDNIELYYDVGDADNPFAPYPGSVQPFGLAARFCLAVVRNIVVWIGGSLNSGTTKPCVMMASLGQAPRTISTPAIDKAFSAAGANLADSEHMAYCIEGHAFVLFTIPFTGETWGVDLDEPGTPWHQRASTTSLTRWRARGICATGDATTFMVGDYATGLSYAMSLTAYTDEVTGVPGAGTAIRRRRRAPYLSAENQWLFIDSIELGCETGVGNVADPDPQITLELSRDSGNNYDTALPVSMGAAGAVDAVVSWQMLGRARADRLVIQVTSDAKVKQVWTPGLWLRASPGTGQL